MVSNSGRRSRWSGRSGTRARLLAAAGICVLAVGCLWTAGAGCRRGDEAAGGGGPLGLSLSVRSLPDGLEMVLTVTNQSRGAVEITFSSGMHYDFVVERRGREVWRWSAGRMFTQAVTTETLEPGGRLTYRGVWDLKDGGGRKVEPGEYEVRARFCGRWDRGGGDAWVGPVTGNVGG